MKIGERERVRERERDGDNTAVPGFLVSFTSEAGTDCAKAVGTARRDGERCRHRQYEKGVLLTQGITTSGVKPPDFLILFWLPPLSLSTLASLGFISFVAPPLFLPEKEEEKGERWVL